MSAPSRLPPALPFPSAPGRPPICRLPRRRLQWRRSHTRLPRSIAGLDSISAARLAPASAARRGAIHFTGANNAFNSGPSFLGGGQIGANYQVNVLVLGVEGDFNWTGIKGNGGDFLGDAIGTETQWTSTVAGRVGAAFNRLLIYGKGGAAFARDRSTFTGLAGHSASSAFTRTGWTAGVGLEYGITANWSAKIEYDYLSFGSQSLNFTTATPTTYASSASLKAQEIKAGINFRFGGPP